MLCNMDIMVFLQSMCGLGSAPGIGMGPSASGPATEVLCMMNMVTPVELRDDEDYEGTQYFYGALVLYLL